MGTPVTVDNWSQQASVMYDKFKSSIDYNIDKQKENHAAWAENFKQAEESRRKEEDNWRKFYEKIYQTETKWWQQLVMFGLNSIQLWALYTQYEQQKEIAERTYELANRQLKLAEEMFSFYKKNYLPHERGLSDQIDNYHKNPYRPQYETTGGRFVASTRQQFIGKRREVLMCASPYCTGALKNSLKQIALAEAKAVGNALNSAVKFEDLREKRMTEKWVNARLSFVGAGRGVAAQGMAGFGRALSAFSSFGADPGAALDQLLKTVAYTVGGLIPQPDAPVESRWDGGSSALFGYNSPMPVAKQTVTVSY